jgi:hypothetical protein
MNLKILLLKIWTKPFYFDMDTLRQLLDPSGPPQRAVSPLQNIPYFFISTMPYHRPFNFTCPIHSLLTQVQRAIISRSILLTMRNIWDKICRENQNTHFKFNNFFYFGNRAVYENVERYCRARKATEDHIRRRTRTACRITKATNTHSQHMQHIPFTLQQRLHERLSM